VRLRHSLLVDFGPIAWSRWRWSSTTGWGSRWPPVITKPSPTFSLTVVNIALQPGAGGAGAVQPAGRAGGGLLLGRGAAAQPRGAAAAVPAGDAALAVGGGTGGGPGRPPETRSKRFLTAAAAAAARSSMGSQLQAMVAMFGLLSRPPAAEAQHRSETASQGSCEAQLHMLSTSQRAAGMMPAMACGIAIGLYRRSRYRGNRN
jgi:hypothetical protein